MAVTRLIKCVLLIAMTTLPTISAEEWTRFRGPNGTGVSAASTVPAVWTDDDYNWQIDLPGKGHSSPVIQGNRLFLTACDEESGTRLLICIDTIDGKVLWENERKFKT